MGLIYKITNKANGKAYIGKTERTFDHRYSASDWVMHSHCDALRFDAQKHGEDAFKVEILVRTDLSGLSLTELEAFFISSHGTLAPHGYNAKLPYRLSGSEELHRRIERLEKNLEQLNSKVDMYMHLTDALIESDVERDAYHARFFCGKQNRVLTTPERDEIYHRRLRDLLECTGDIGDPNEEGHGRIVSNPKRIDRALTHVLQNAKAH